jgi:polyribonucleotide nucleotidyltransferase
MEKKIKFENKEIKINFDEYALLTNASAMIELEGTKILITLNTKADEDKIPGFLPLQIIFQERMYAANKIPGGFNKREGKPSDYATLLARLVDRSIRPLFPKNLATDIQIVIMPISVTNEEHLPFLSLLGTSLVIQKSGLPFKGPVSGIGATLDNDNKIHVSPNGTLIKDYKAKFFFAGPKDLVNMVEYDGYELDKKEYLKHSKTLYSKIKELNKIQTDFMKTIKIKKEPKLVHNDKDEEALKLANDNKKLIEDISKIKTYLGRREASSTIMDKLISLNENKDLHKGKIIDAFYHVYGETVRNKIIKDKIRNDGRKVDELRDISSKVEINKNGHGSSLFNRGYTQVAGFLTLGSMKEYQMIDNLTSEEEKLFIHHYNFPPYSVGENGRFGIPSRREVGHGNLAEKSLAKILPSLEDFPYTIRIVSEVLTSNGSTSQGAICAGVLALMDGGVPIKAPIAGIAMGLISDKGIVLTDIEGLEDHCGDMDFKISGSKDGFTAVQMDIKVEGIPEKLMEEIVNKGQVGYLKILDLMLKTIKEPRKDLKPTAIKYESFKIDKDMIGKVIGPGGKNIKDLIERNDEVKIDIEDDGSVFIYHYDRKIIELVTNEIKSITKVFKVGEVFKKGKVTRVEDFGAFVNIGEQDALVHVSKLSKEFLKSAKDVIKVGDELDIEITEINRGKIQAKKI